MSIHIQISSVLLNYCYRFELFECSNNVGGSIQSEIKQLLVQVDVHIVTICQT